MHTCCCAAHVWWRAIASAGCCCCRLLLLLRHSGRGSGREVRTLLHGLLLLVAGTA
jgi:hypothetical protein